KGTIQILTQSGAINYSSHGEVSPLESNVIELSRAKSRYFEYGARLIINYENFSLLIKNMPIDDPDRVGTLRDSLGILCNAMEARIESIIEQTINYQKSQITQDVKVVLEQSQNTFSEIEKNTIAAINELTDAIENSFLSLGLTESQEDEIRDIIQHCMESTNAAFDSSRELYQMFGEINASLDAMQSLGKKTS
ncbi:MAG: hypothetical protein R3240_10805, partial [Gammaproteobacteria bacterium]|nr:hypothetical protein [Gammaproteobacteria bacterium]